LCKYFLEDVIFLLSSHFAYTPCNTLLSYSSPYSLISISSIFYSILLLTALFHHSTTTQVCALEALNISADWNYPAPISRTPVYAYTLVLLFDCILYCALAAIFIEMNHRTNTPSISPPEKAVARRRSLWGSDNDGGRSTGYGSVHQDFYGSGREGWRTLSEVCGVIAGAVSQGVGYFWGCQVSTIPHNYSTLSQEQRACIDNYDVNVQSNNFGLRSLKKVPKRSTSAHDIKSNSHFENPLPLESGSRSVRDMDVDIRGIDGPRNRSTIESVDNRNVIGKYAHQSNNSNSNNRNNNGYNNRSGEGLRLPQGIGPLPGTGAGTGAEAGPYMNRGSSMDVQGGYKEGPGQGQGPQQIPQGFLRPLKACMRITDLRKEYVTARTGVVVLEEVSAELKQGTVTCLLGTSVINFFLLFLHLSSLLIFFLSLCYLLYSFIY
jgi:hypothetical protein